MSQTIHAVYENGVFRPMERINLPERCEVEVEVRQVHAAAGSPSLDEVYALLSERFNSGQSDIAARHDEHQP